MVQNEEAGKKYSRDKWILGILVVSVVLFIIIRVLMLIKGTGAF